MTIDITKEDHDAQIEYHEWKQKRDAYEKQRAAEIKGPATSLIHIMQDHGWTELHIERSCGVVQVKVAAEDYAPTPYVVASFCEFSETW